MLKKYTLKEIDGTFLEIETVNTIYIFEEVAK